MKTPKIVGNRKSNSSDNAAARKQANKKQLSFDIPKHQTTLEPARGPGGKHKTRQPGFLQPPIH